MSPSAKNGSMILFLAISMIYCAAPSNCSDIPFAFTKDTAGLENLSAEQLTDLYNGSNDTKYIPNLILREEDFNTSNKYMSIFTNKILNDNETIKRISNKIVMGRTGDLTIEQIYTIYDYLRYGRNGIGGWYYVADQVVSENESSTFSSASETLRIGERMNYSGFGDCDDFAIAIASLVKAIGGNVRIIIVKDDSKMVHAYSEVYLGSLSEPDNEIYYLTQLLMLKYRVDKIYTHINPVSKEVWLNLDAPLNLGGQSYPGVAHSPGSAHYVIVDFSSATKKKITEPEYRSMINIVNESMNSPEAIGELRKADEKVDQIKNLLEISGINTSEFPSTKKFEGDTYNLLGSFGLFDIDMAKLAYGNASMIPDPNAESLYLVIDLKKMLNDPAMNNASMEGSDQIASFNWIINNSMIVQDGREIPLNEFFSALGIEFVPESLSLLF